MECVSRELNQRWYRLTGQWPEYEHELQNNTDLMLILMYGILMNVCRCFTTFRTESLWKMDCTSLRIGCASKKGFLLLFITLLSLILCSATAKMNCYYFRILWDCMCVRTFFYTREMVIVESWGSAWWTFISSTVEHCKIERKGTALCFSFHRTATNLVISFVQIHSV